MVRRLVKRIEVKTKEMNTLILKSGQIMEVSIEEDNRRNYHERER